MADTRATVMVVFGGRSSEHTISCATAGGVLSAIDRDKYTVIPVGITLEGAFTLQPDDADRFRLNPDDMPMVDDNGTRIVWPTSTASRELRVEDADGTTRSLGDVDVVFPILHGPYGEDGTVQGLIELLGLPYVGNGVLASALGMDKHYTKTALQAAGVSVAPWVTVSPADWSRDNARWRSRAASLGLPVFVKPARAGSSVGVTKVTDADDLDDAITEFGKTVRPGGNAILAQTDEADTAALDALVTKYDGAIVRRPLDEVLAELEAQQDAAEAAAEAARKKLHDEKKVEKRIEAIIAFGLIAAMACAKVQ